MMLESSTAWIQTALDQFLAGDAAARDELVHYSEQRLKELVFKFFGEFGPSREETAGVISAAYGKFKTSLVVVRPQTTRQYFSLAYLQMKRVLLDLTRTNQSNTPPPAPRNSPASAEEPNPDTPAQQVVELLGAVENLDDKLKDAVIMVYFHSLTESEAATVLGQHSDVLRMHLARARAVLASHLTSLHPEDW